MVGVRTRNPSLLGGAPARSPGSSPLCSSPGLSRGATRRVRVVTIFARAPGNPSHLTTHLFAPRLPMSHGTTGENLKWHAGAGHVPSAQVPPGKDFVPVLVKRMSNSILEAHFESLFSGATSGGNYGISQGPSKKQMARSQR